MTSALFLSSKTTMTIGDDNLFQIGCRACSACRPSSSRAHLLSPGIESPSVGSRNVFGPRSRVSYTVSISSHCNIGPGCVVLPTPFPPSFLDQPVDSHSADEDAAAPPPHIDDEGMRSEVEGRAMEVDEVAVPAPVPPAAESDAPPSLETGETLPDCTIVFGSENRRRIWTGEGGGQARALHAKHLEYLQATLPKYNKLRMF